MARKLSALSDDELLAELDQVTVDLRKAQGAADKLAAHRLAIWQEARDRTPPIKIAVIAARSKLAEVSVNKAMRKARNGTH